MPRPTPAQTRTVAATPADAAEGSIRFSTLNIAVLLAAAVAIVLGYVLLSGGDTVAAPLLLVLGYAILIPLGLVL